MFFSGRGGGSQPAAAYTQRTGTNASFEEDYDPFYASRNPSRSVMLSSASNSSPHFPHQSGGFNRSTRVQSDHSLVTYYPSGVIVEEPEDEDNEAHSTGLIIDEHIPSSSSAPRHCGLSPSGNVGDVKRRKIKPESDLLSDANSFL